MYFFIEFKPLCQMLWAFLSNFGFIMMSAHQIWSCYVTQEANCENFFFCPYSTFNIRKVTKFLAKKLSTSEVISQKPHGGGGGGYTPFSDLELSNFTAF